MRLLRRVVFWVAVMGLGLGVNQALIHPDTPLPEAWNPTKPLAIADTITPLTGWKIQSALAQPDACVAVLQDAGLNAQQMPDFEESDVCHIRNRVALSSTGDAKVQPFETTCAIALRMAMWERHGLQPAAQAILGQGVREIRHYSSYNCRAIRTSSGNSTRMSTHATARSVDVSGFVLDDGTTIDLRRDWTGGGEKAQFLRQAQETACDHFGLVLGPEYNSLHADHFHIQLDWDGCR